MLKIVSAYYRSVTIPWKINAWWNGNESHVYELKNYITQRLQSLWTPLNIKAGMETAHYSSIMPSAMISEYVKKRFDNLVSKIADNQSKRVREQYQKKLSACEDVSRELSILMTFETKVASLVDCKVPT